VVWVVLPTLTKRRNYYEIKIKNIRKNINKTKYFIIEKRKYLNIFYIDSILISHNDWRFNATRSEKCSRYVSYQ